MLRTIYKYFFILNIGKEARSEFNIGVILGNLTLFTKEHSAKIFAVMGLGAKQGETVTFRIEGENEEAAAAELEKFMNENL